MGDRLLQCNIKLTAAKPVIAAKAAKAKTRAVLIAAARGAE